MTFRHGAEVALIDVDITDNVSFGAGSGFFTQAAAGTLVYIASGTYDVNGLTVMDNISLERGAGLTLVAGAAMPAGIRPVVRGQGLWSAMDATSEVPPPVAGGAGGSTGEVRPTR